MTLRGVRKVYRLSRRWWYRNQPRAIILVYHRVTEIELNPHLLCVSPQHIAEHLQVLCQMYHPLSLQELNQKLIQGRIQNHSIVITFDDGYADNL